MSLAGRTALVTGVRRRDGREYVRPVHAARAGRLVTEVAHATLTETVRSRGPSNSHKKIVCSDPRASFPSSSGMVTELAVRAERTCAQGLRSPSSLRGR